MGGLLMQQVAGQYLPSWTLPNVWEELFFEGYEEWNNDCEDWVCFSIFDGSTGEWVICSRLCVKPELALVRCGSCGSSCVLDGLAQEEGASERASRMLEWILLFVATCPVFFEEENGHQKTPFFKWSGGSPADRAHARYRGAVGLCQCIKMFFRRNGGEWRATIKICSEWWSKALFVLLM